MFQSDESERLHFRVLYRQFLLRIVDLEALSSKADVVKLLGQFAAILVMFSLLQALVALLFQPARMPAAERLAVSWTMEHHLIALTMLFAGLFSVLSWDAILPDRRDVMILGPLPVRARTLFLAKLAASGTAVALSVLALNVASGIAWPLVLAQDGVFGIVRSFAAYWITMLAAATLIFTSLLSIQGMGALLLARGSFLRVSACLQLLGVGLFLGMYFLQPEIATPSALASRENQRVLLWLPTYWFLALFNQLKGSLDPRLAWLARRAWLALGITCLCSGGVFLASSVRLLRKIAEEADIKPRATKLSWIPNFGDSLRSAIVLFNWRSLMRSRQHRLVLAFYLGLGFAISLATLEIPVTQHDILSTSGRLISLRFLISTIVMLSFAVVGVRVAFALPLSLQANWLFRITEVHRAREYFQPVRQSLLLMGVAPIIIGSACFAMVFEPWRQSGAHLAVLFLLGLIFTDLSLFRFHKIPFTCSYLPGKANVQFVFWAYVLLLIRLTESFARYEQRALELPSRLAETLAMLVIAALCIWMRSRGIANSAVLQFDELPTQEIVSLGLNSD